MHMVFSTGYAIVDDQGPVLAVPTIPSDPSSPWRCVEALGNKQLRSSMYPFCHTLDDLWRRAVKEYYNDPIFGTRDLLAVDYELQPTGRRFKKLTQGAYKWLTYGECDRQVEEIAAGLTHVLKLCGGPNSDRVVIFSETRMQWMLCAQACFRTAIPLVTLYSTLADSALIHGIQEADVDVMITSDELLPKVVGLLTGMPSIKTVIYMESDYFNKTAVTLVDVGSLKKPDHVKIMSLRHFQGLGRKALDSGAVNTADALKPTADDLAIIMYTSGSTGLPKGVLIAHKNLMSAMVGFVDRLPVLYQHSDRYLAYLPLAHVMELCCELQLCANGIPIGYGTPLTLTDNSNKVKYNTKGDARELRPTLLVCVPVIVDRIHKTVWEKVNEGGALSHEVFKWSLDYKLRRLSYGFRSLLLDRLVFRKIRSVLGGRLRYMLSGGAPLSEGAQIFMNACFGRVLQGYGLTETCCACAIAPEHNLRPSHVGAPLTCVEIRIRDWSEGEFSPWDEPNPRGEILISGDCVAQGYYKQPQLTAESYITDDQGKRWFCTGDIGLFHPDGTLSIIDRKKDFVKLASGEYLSLGRVEVALCDCELLETLCIYGDSLQNEAVAIAVPKRKQMMQLMHALQMGDIDDSNYDDYLQRDIVRKAVLKRLCEVARDKQLTRSEYPSAIYLDSIPWTPDTGLVTDAFKLRRKFIQSRYQEQINAMYCIVPA